MFYRSDMPLRQIAQCAATARRSCACKPRGGHNLIARSPATRRAVRLRDALSPARRKIAAHARNARHVRVLSPASSPVHLARGGSTPRLPPARTHASCRHKRRFIYGSIRMARFSMLELLLQSDSRCAEFFASLTGGSSGHDHLNGTAGGNFLFAGASNDTVAGMAGNDTLSGGSGDDKVWGGSGNDS